MIVLYELLLKGVVSLFGRILRYVLISSFFLRWWLVDMLAWRVALVSTSKGQGWLSCSIRRSNLFARPRVGPIYDSVAATTGSMLLPLHIECILAIKATNLWQRCLVLVDGRCRPLASSSISIADRRAIEAFFDGGCFLAGHDCMALVRTQVG